MKTNKVVHDAIIEIFSEWRHQFSYSSLWRAVWASVSLHQARRMACARVRTHTADGTECFPKGSDNPSSRWRRGENPGWVMQRDRIKRHPDQRPRQEGWSRCNPCVAMMAEKPGTWQSAYLTKNDGRAHKRQASIHPCIQNWRQFLQDNKAHGEMLYLMLYTCVFVPFISVSSDRNTPYTGLLMPCRGPRRCDLKVS